VVWFENIPIDKKFSRNGFPGEFLSQLPLKTKDVMSTTTFSQIRSDSHVQIHKTRYIILQLAQKLQARTVDPYLTKLLYYLFHQINEN
jgi:hypothetical protein